MENCRNAEKLIKLTHTEGGCGGEIAISSVGTLKGLLVIRGLCRKCDKSVPWEKSLQQLMIESPGAPDPQVEEVG